MLQFSSIHIISLSNAQRVCKYVFIKEKKFKTSTAIAPVFVALLLSEHQRPTIDDNIQIIIIIVIIPF